MSKQVREYVEARLAAVEDEAARLRTALEVIEDYESERPDPPKVDKTRAEKKKGGA